MRERERDREMRETQGRRDALLLIKQRRKMKGGKKKEKEKRKREERRKERRKGGGNGRLWPTSYLASGGRRWPAAGGSPWGIPNPKTKGVQV